MSHHHAIRRLRALCASARTANLPSVVCNVWLGAALSTVVTPVHTCFSLLALCGTALYCGGNLLNDWHDRHWDALHRPERALPTGIFSPGAYLAGASALLALGMLAAWTVSPAAGATAAILLGSVIGYTVWHKRHPGAVVLMGLCRALLPMLALAAPVLAAWQAGDPARVLICLAPALALGLYTTGLSLIARGESAENRGAGMLPAAGAAGSMPAPHGALLLIFSAGGIMCLPLVLIAPHPALAATALLPFLIWTLRSLPRDVGGLLAGFPLLDAVLLLPLGLATRAAGFELQHWLPCLLLPPAAWAAALLLRRFAPAT